MVCAAIDRQGWREAKRGARRCGPALELKSTYLSEKFGFGQKSKEVLQSHLEVDGTGCAEGEAKRVMEARTVCV